MLNMQSFSVTMKWGRSAILEQMTYYSREKVWIKPDEIGIIIRER